MKKKIKLGYTPHYMMDSLARPEKDSKPKKPPIYHPTVTLEGKSADQIAPGLKIGETFTAEVEFKVTSIAMRDPQAKSEYGIGPGSGRGTTVELELQHIEKEDVADAASGDPEESAEGAVDSYLSGKAANSGGSGTDEDEDA